MTEEGKLQSKIIKAMEQDFDALALKIMRANKSGIPDLLVLLTNGKVMFIEVKSAAGKPSQLQEYYVKEIQKRKCCAFVCWSLEDAIAMARKLMG